MIDNFDHTQEGLSKEIGKSRSHIANLLRLLNLPPAVHELLISGKLTAGHARALVTCDNPLAIAKQIISLGLSVRDAEQLAKNVNEKKVSNKASDTITKMTAENLELNNKLKQVTAKLKVNSSELTKAEEGKKTLAKNLSEKEAKLNDKMKNKLSAT